MRRTRFDSSVCPIARVTDLLGDWWTPIVLRELFYGRTRFDEIQAAIGISRPVLSARFERLVDEGLVGKERYQDHPPRYDYRLTEKGRASWSVLAAMWRYGTDWLFDGGPPGELFDKETGQTIVPEVVDATTGGPLTPERTRVRARSERNST